MNSKDNKNKITKIQNALFALKDQMLECQLCPRDCKVDRTQNTRGFCKLSDKIKIYKLLLTLRLEFGILTYFWVPVNK